MWSSHPSHFVAMMVPCVPFVSPTAINLYREVLGIVTSGGFGHTIGKTIAFAYLPPAEAVHSDYVIEAFGREIQVTRHDQCLYDPKRERILS